MTLSTEVYNHVIVFHDKSTKFITVSQSALLMQASCTDAKSITTPALGMIVFASIAKIITIEDYYNQYPDKRPSPRPTEFSALPREMRTLEQEGLASESRRKSMIRGINEYITQAEARGEDPKNAKKIMQSWQRIGVHHGVEGANL